MDPLSPSTTATSRSKSTLAPRGQDIARARATASCRPAAGRRRAPPLPPPVPTAAAAATLLRRAARRCAWAQIDNGTSGSAGTGAVDSSWAAGDGARGNKRRNQQNYNPHLYIYTMLSRSIHTSTPQHGAHTTSGIGFSHQPKAARPHWLLRERERGPPPPRAAVQGVANMRRSRGAAARAPLESAIAADRCEPRVPGLIEVHPPPPGGTVAMNQS